MSLGVLRAILLFSFCVQISLSNEFRISPEVRETIQRYQFEQLRQISLSGFEDDSIYLDFAGDTISSADNQSGSSQLITTNSNDKSSVSFAMDLTNVISTDASKEELNRICEERANRENKEQIEIEIVFGLSSEAIERFEELKSRITSNYPEDFSVEDYLKSELDRSNNSFKVSGLGHIKLIFKAALLMDDYFQDQESQRNDFRALKEAEATRSGGPLERLKFLFRVAKGDALALITGKNTPDTCGRGGLPFIKDKQIIFTPISVTAFNCFSNHTFTHEIGHNMGLVHDSRNNSHNPIYSIGAGYVRESDYTKTIMATTDAIPARQEGFVGYNYVLTRLPYFSNPRDTLDKNGDQGETPRGLAGQVDAACAVDLIAKDFSSIGDGKLVSIDNEYISILPVVK